MNNEFLIIIVVLLNSATQQKINAIQVSWKKSLQGD